jgi:hypothetical protein
MAGQTQTEDVETFSVEDLTDASRTARRVGEAARKQGAALNLFRNKLEGPVPIARQLLRVLQPAGTVATEGHLGCRRQAIVNFHPQLAKKPFWSR